ncbi:MAG: hypothetical protein U0073_04155 [Bacteroidia bacterium]
MLHAEDNLIKNKLEESELLPQDYRPDLESKWNILDTALNSNKNNIEYFSILKIGIAASILLLLGLGWYLNTVKTIRTNSADTPIVSVPDQKPTNIAEPSTETPKQNFIATLPKAHKNFHQKKKKSNLPVNAPTIETQAILPDATTENIPEPQTSDQLAATLQMQSSVKSARYVQLDFGTESGEISRTSANAEPTFRVRIISTVPPELNSTPQNTSRPIRLFSRF